jgi:hypothetical protein
MIFVLLPLVAFGCFAEDAAPPVQICNVLRNENEFEGRLIELHTDIRVTMHGRYLVGSECAELGSLGLVIDDKKYKNSRVKEFVNKIYSDGGWIGLILIGYPSKASSSGLNGSFILHDVKSSSEKKTEFRCDTRVKRCS